MSEVNDLLAELDAEFGKKKKEKVAKLKEAAKQLSRAQFANNADWRMAQLMQDSNAISQSEAFHENWKPVARETWIMRQFCTCCGSSVEYIAGEYVRFQNNRLHGTIRRRTEGAADEFHFNKDIAEEFVHLEQDIARCPSCINAERMVDELWDQTQEKILVTAEEQLIIPGIDK